ncbi:MAG: N-acetylmuramic acid 6-phosphate etherase [Owenweeksia sp.]|nr:N-acetylmuramic acid 6-phosphate etherase [Owenweeksia sp.]
MNTTESDSLYNNLEQMATRDLLININREDQKVAQVVKSTIPAIELLVDDITEKMQTGGRLFYIGSGTSGRLGVLDASELPPTFGADSSWVVGIIAGGDQAIRKAVEHAEDDPKAAMQDLKEYDVSDRDVAVGIAASGTTPYVVGGLELCREQGITTGCITCNAGAPLLQHANFPIVAEVGPEFVSGSTRMKAGTAQKLILNMLSTSVMIKLGRVKGNKMVDMQLSNKKLLNRGVRMLMGELDIDAKKAEELLKKYGSVRAAIQDNWLNPFNHRLSAP